MRAKPGGAAPWRTRSARSFLVIPALHRARACTRQPFRNRRYAPRLPTRSIGSQQPLSGRPLLFVIPNWSRSRTLKAVSYLISWFGMIPLNKIGW